MADLVSGGYAQRSPAWAALGLLANETQPDIPARSNLEWGVGQWVDGAVAGSGVACAVAVPIDAGTTVSRVTMFAGATAASTPTHWWVALYSGIATPALIGTQSADQTTTAIAASGIYNAKLGSPYTVTSADCKNGYIYVVYSITATAPNTAWGLTTPTAVNYQGLTASTTPAAVQPMYAATSGSSLGATAPATLTLASKAVAPVVVLT
jgi:hypothetical protein